MRGFPANSAENIRHRRLSGGAGWIRTPGAARPSMGGIQPQFGALFGPTKSICAGENLFAWDSALLRLSPIRFVRRIEVKISGMPPLPGALALQIMLVLTRWSGIAICSSCGRLFSPSRRPNPNRNAYCKGCGVRAAWREAQARRRERKLTNQKTRRIS